MSEVPYARLNDGELFEIEPVHNANNDGTPAASYLNQGGSNQRIDYVLVYETSHDDESRDEESAAEAERLERLRTSFEKQLEKEGLILQQRTRDIKVRCMHGCLNSIQWPLLHALHAYINEREELKVSKINNNLVNVAIELHF